MIGEILGPALSYLGQQETNRANVTSAKDATAAGKQMSREQMAFQERMSNTAHQRGVADLKAAGLNPLLAMQTQASTPQGASSSGIPAVVENSLGMAANSAREFSQLALQTKKQKEEIDLMKKQGKKTLADTRASEAMSELYQTNAKDIKQNMIIKGPLQRANDTLNYLFDASGNEKSKYKTPSKPTTPFNPLRMR